MQERSSAGPVGELQVLQGAAEVGRGEAEQGPRPVVGQRQRAGDVDDDLGHRAGVEGASRSRT